MTNFRKKIFSTPEIGELRNNGLLPMLMLEVVKIKEPIPMNLWFSLFPSFPQSKASQTTKLEEYWP